MARTVMTAAILAIALTATACGESTHLHAHAAHAAVARRPYKASCINQRFTAFVLVVRPARCIMAASPNAPFARAANLRSLRWTSWGRARTTARGYELGFHLPYSRIRATVILTRPSYVEELRIYVYKRFSVTTRFGTIAGTIQAG